MSKDNGTRFRKEAAPVAVARLSQSQQKTREFIVKQIEAAVSLIRAKHSDKRTVDDIGTVHIDRDRRNQVIFISGSRGSGKTSVVLSIIDEFLHPSEFSDTKKNESSEAIRLIRENVVWLDLLDLDPLPKNANLLLALLARIHDVLHKSGNASQPNKEFREASQKLRQIQSDLALAWDGNLESRKGNIDIDQYATELKRVETARLNLNQQLSLALQSVSKAIQKPECLFVLVVDDFDLNPLKAIELTQYLRVFSVPELCTIMLGDIGITEEMFSLVLTGELDKISPRHQGLLFTSPTEISANALRKLLPLTQRFIIDNFQIKEALKFDPDRALRQSAKIFLKNTLKRLLKGIKFQIIKSPMSTDDNQTERINLKKFLLVERKLLQKRNKQPAYIYHAVQILAAPPRHIADLWLDLYHLKNAQEEDQNNENRLLDLSAQILRHALNEDSELTAQGRYVLRKSFYKDPLRNEWELDVNSTYLHGRTGSDLSLTNVKPKLYDGVRVNCRVIVRRFFRWMIQPQIPLEYDYTFANKLKSLDNHLHEDGSPKTRLGRSISTYSTSAYMLFHDLLSLTSKGSVIGRIEDENMTQRAYTEWHVGMQKPFTVPWFISTWETFRDFSQFADIWNIGKVIARETRYSGTKVDDTDITRFMAYVWIVGGVSTLDVPSDAGNDSDDSSNILYYLTKAQESIGKKGTKAENENQPHKIVEFLFVTDDKSLDSEKIDERNNHWYELSKRIQEMAERLMERRQKHADDLSTILLLNWFVNLAYLLCPETGVDINILKNLGLINELTKRCEKERLWELSDPMNNSIWKLWFRPFVAREIRRHRAERLGKFAYSKDGLNLVVPYTYNKILRGQMPSSLEIVSDKYQSHQDKDNSTHPFNHLRIDDSLLADEDDSDSTRDKDSPIFSPSRTELLAVLLNESDREYKENPGADPKIFNYFFPGEVNGGK